MSEQRKFICDCGCGCTGDEDESKNWFVLNQRSFLPTQKNDEPKLDREVHFATLECLQRWTDKALKAILGLQKAAANLDVRGAFVSKDVEGLYI